MKKNLRKIKEKNRKLNEISKIISGDAISSRIWQILPSSSLEILENNLNLTLEQIKIMKLSKNSLVSSTNSAFSYQFSELFHEKCKEYLRNLENKRRIPFDLLEEIEKFTKLRENETKFPSNHVVNKNISESYDKNEENLLTNVSHLYEEKFEIENIIE